jgi:RNA polymerase-binding transcription factor DksA
MKKEDNLCNGCGNKIPAARVKALPDVKLCVVCAEEEERNNPNPIRHDIATNVDGLGDILSGND